MNIYIETTVRKDAAKGIKGFFAPALVRPFGKTCLLLLALLLVTETYYRNHYSTQAGTTYIGGPASVIGLAGFLGLLLPARASFRNYMQRITEAGRLHYLRITDDGIEEGITGLWQRNINHQLLEAFREHHDGFVIETGQHKIWVKKSDLKDKSHEEEIRSFFKQKSPHVSS